MLSPIYKISEITDRVKRDTKKNLYHRVNQAQNGNTRGLTADLVSEIQEIIIAEHKKTIDNLNRLKKQLSETPVVEGEAA